MIHSCLTCCKLEGKPFQSVPSLSLPEYCVRQFQPFCYTGVGFAGLFYTKQSVISEIQKVWLCLYTCCVTRAVHLNLVPNLNDFTFLRSFKSFSARRGVPSKVWSDNGKTFNLKRTPPPQWGGIFERIMKSTKCSLMKTVGRASLTYDKLLTLVTEIEAVLNSMPLTYVSMDDLGEPLTLSLTCLATEFCHCPICSSTITQTTMNQPMI